MAKAGAHGGTGQESRLDFASGRGRSDSGAVGVGGGETVAPVDERMPNEVRRHRNELGSGSRVRVDNNVDANALRRVLSVLGER
jgi:hypothetical protein